MDTSKIEKFVDALENTGNPDNEKRKEVESFIQAEKQLPGFCQAMMQIASNADYAQNRVFDVNLAAAIQLKNMVEHHWRFTSEGDIHEYLDVDDDDGKRDGPSIIITEEDKEFVKKHIIQALSHAPSFGVLAQFEEIIYEVARYEMPDKWPNAMGEIEELINNDEEVKVFGGLIALKEVVHKFEYEFKERREPLQQIVNKIFPRLEQILEGLIEVETEDAVKAKNIIAQTIYLANQVKLSRRYHNAKQFDALIALVMKAFTHPLAAEYTDSTDDADKVGRLLKTDQWQLKKNCMKFLNRLFTQLADTELVEDEYVKISEHFVSRHAKSFLELALSIIENSLTNFVANEIVSYAIRIISKTEKIPELFAHVKDHQEDIIFKYCLPLLQLTPIEIEEFRDNPVSYIRTQFDISDTLNSAKNSGIDLMNYFVTYNEDEENKGGDDEDFGDDYGDEDAPKKEAVQPPYLQKFLNFLHEGLTEHDKHPEADFRVKESIMLALGHLSKELLKYKELYAGIEVILKDHVFPELSGSNEMLKTRALWLYGQLALFVTEPEHAIKVVEEVYKCLLDESLPVKVFAGTSLHKLSKHKEAKKILEPGVADIIGAYLKAMHEIDQDELVNALEEIVNIFDDKIEPFAFELIQQLNIRFKKVVKNEGDESGEAVLTANGCICAIRRIIAAVSKRKDLLEHIEDEIYPSILFCMTPKGLDYVEDCLDCAILLVYHRQAISEKMWKLFFHMFKIIIGNESNEVESADGGYGFEFLPIMQSFFQNCIAFGGDALFQFEVEGETPFQLLTKSISRILEIEKNMGEMYASSVCVMKLIGTILENCAGKVDNVLPDFVSLLQREIDDNPPSKIYKSSILQAFAMCFVYNTTLTYMALENLGITDQMLKAFFSNIKIFKKTYEIRRVLYGMSCIIANDPRHAPEILSTEISAIMNVIVVLIDTYVTAKEKEINKEMKEANQMRQLNNEGYEDEEEFRNIMAKLKEIKKTEGKLIDFGNDGGDDEDEDDEDYDLGDELIYTAGDLELYDSPLEKVDAPIYFKNIMDHLQSANPELYTMLVGTITPEQNQQLVSNFEKNEKLLKIEKEEE